MKIKDSDSVYSESGESDSFETKTKVVDVQNLSSNEDKIIRRLAHVSSQASSNKVLAKTREKTQHVIPLNLEE